ncbi:hypothetical protein, conserved [Leishmania tarentolae]|uniref:AAA+ ATPase domain-containing protein n=1 Tax=Leishmania tarentolae TaxID=5689 RepID=A0A640KR98_LEITA|nr:hypothetical protein, conserved [Leishmania tarentolae]
MDRMDIPFSPGSLGSLTNLLLAAVVPFLCMRAFTFLFHDWPNFLYRRLTSCFDRQVAMVMERVKLNRVIQDDIMIRSIMGYVSYCYVCNMQRSAEVCDAISTADYEYTFLFGNATPFEEDWVPYSARFPSLFGRVIASCMELSVVPSYGYSIQVEPGLFLRFLPNKNALGGSMGNDRRWSEKSQQSSERPNGGKRPGAAVGETSHIDKLNKYMFYSMRRYAENMDAHSEPRLDGREDEVISEERPFDPQVGCDVDRDSGNGSVQLEPTFCENPKYPPEERIVVLEYRRPLPHEYSRALCNSGNTADGVSEFDAAQSAEDVMEGFLGRVQRWYLEHLEQSKREPLLVIYPSLMMAQLSKTGTAARTIYAGDVYVNLSGRYYVLESAAQVNEDITGAAIANSTSSSVKMKTTAGGYVGLGVAELSKGPQGKTFHSLFFPGKESILSLIDDFVEERGRFAVPGVVRRLNFFLCGAPGTGKTSFVKALARHLRRSLVVVSMSDIITVNELRQILQPFEMDIEGGGVPLSVLPNQSVYVFEDFDAIGSAWEALIKVQEQQQKLIEEPHLETSKKSSDDEVRVSDDDGGDRLQEASPPSSAVCRSDGSFGSQENDSDDGNAEFRYMFPVTTKEQEEIVCDRLTVERFVDLFNGLDLPDSFIAVFTTNHPERINPLIASSSVMDVTLDMDMLDDECATQMVEHYYAAELADQTVDSGGRRHLSTSQLVALSEALRLFNAGSHGLSGALLERMCIECDTVAALTARLSSASSFDAVDVF